MGHDEGCSWMGQDQWGQVQGNYLVDDVLRVLPPSAKDRQRYRSSSDFEVQIVMTFVVTESCRRCQMSHTMMFFCSDLLVLHYLDELLRSNLVLVADLVLSRPILQVDVCFAHLHVDQQVFVLSVVLE